MIVSEKGLGKCTLTSEFSAQNRGGKGVKCYKITEKTGNIIGVKSVNMEDEMMLITTEGIIIRIKVSDTTLLGRITSGVKLINLDKNVTVASIAKVYEDKSLLEYSDTSELLSEEELQKSAEFAAENAKKATGKADSGETDEELIKELLNRAEQDDESDE
jgi:DNA gyrase subunit A